MAGIATLLRDEVHAHQDDRVLIRLAAAGDADAFRVLYQRHSPRLARFVESAGVTGDDCAEVLQRAFVRAWEHLDSCQADGNVAGWLFAITRSELLMRHRSARVTAELNDTLPAAAAAADPEEIIVARIAFHETVQDIASLPPMQRQTVTLRAWEDRSYDEIADMLHTKPAASRRAYATGIQALRIKRQGRQLPCHLIRERIDHGDRRELRARDIRAHLDTCEPCATYATYGTRPSLSHALLPVGLIALGRRLAPRLLSTTRAIATTAAPAKAGLVALVIGATLTFTTREHHRDHVTTAHSARTVRDNIAHAPSPSYVLPRAHHPGRAARSGRLRHRDHAHRELQAPLAVPSGNRGTHRTIAHPSNPIRSAPETPDPNTATTTETSTMFPPVGDPATAAAAVAATITTPARVASTIATPTLAPTTGLLAAAPHTP